MSENSQPKKFYVTLESQTGSTIKSCKVSINPPSAKDEALKEIAKTSGFAANEDETNSFGSVIKSFRAMMDGYQSFIPLTAAVAPHLAYQLGFGNIKDLVTNKATKIEHMCMEMLMCLN